MTFILDQADDQEWLIKRSDWIGSDRLRVGYDKAKAVKAVEWLNDLAVPVVRPPICEYEYYIESSPSDAIQMTGWFPIATDLLKSAGDIDDLIAKGKVRRIQR